MGKWAAASGFVLLLSGSASAESRLEVSVLSGSSLETLEGTRSAAECSDCPTTVVTQSSLGTNALVGVRFGYGLRDRLVLEAGFAAEPSRTLEATTSFRCPPGFACPLVIVRVPDRSVASYDFDGALRYEVATSSVRPFLLAGLGGVAFGGANDAGTRFAANFGFGVTVGHGRLRGRLELNDDLIFSHFVTGRTEQDVRVRGGLTFGL